MYLSIINICVSKRGNRSYSHNYKPRSAEICACAWRNEWRRIFGAAVDRRRRRESRLRRHADWLCTNPPLSGVKMFIIVFAKIWLPLFWLPLWSEAGVTLWGLRFSSRLDKRKNYFFYIIPNLVLSGIVDASDDHYASALLWDESHIWNVV